MNNFEKTLQKYGDAILKDLAGADKFAAAAEPFLDTAFPLVAPIYNATVASVAKATAAAKAAIDPQAGDGANLAAICVAVAPELAAYAKTTGLTPPSTATIINYASAQLEKLKTL